MASVNISKRSANFSTQEESLLVSLAQKHKKVLECKLTDMITHEEKRKAWNKIETQFNSMSGQSHRTQEVLRRKYDNIKKRVKKKYSEEKCYSRGTGGGPPRNTTFTDIDNVVKEILGTRIEGRESQLDDDAETLADKHIFMDEEANLPSNGISLQDNIAASQHEIDLQEEEFILLDESQSFLENTFTISDDNVPSTSTGITANDSYTFTIPDDNVPSTSTGITANGTLNNSSWARYNPNMLKTKKSQELQTAKKKQISTTISDRVSQWAEAKCQLQQSQSHLIEKENELKLKLMQDKHDKEIALMQDKHDKEMSIMEKESALKKKLMVEESRVKISKIMEGRQF